MLSFGLYFVYLSILTVETGDTSVVVVVC